MATRPSNIGIKAIELYFPSQVRQIHARFTHTTSVLIEIARSSIK